MLKSRELKAKATLHLETGRPSSNQPFLRRNLRNILDYKEREFSERTADATALDGMNADDIAIPRARWQPPSKESLAELIQAQHSQLWIKSLLLRHTTSDSRATRDTVARERARVSQSWFPSPTQWKLQILVNVSIRQQGQTKIEIYRCKTDADIIRFNDGRDIPVFSVELRRPLVLALDQLTVSKNIQSSGSDAKWAEVLDDRYALEISLQPRNSKDSAEFLSQLESMPLSDYVNAPSNEGIVRIVWGDTTQGASFPDLPNDGQLLTCRRARGHKSIKLEHGSEVNMEWKNRRSGSVLSNYNMRRTRLERQHQLPMPSPSDDFRETKGRRAPRLVRYLIQSETFVKRKVDMTNLSCIFCSIRGQHSSFLQLLNHYHTHHNHFTFDVNDDEEDPGVKVVSMSVDDDYHIQQEPESEDFDWESSGALLDLAAHTIVRDTAWTIHYVDRSDGTKKNSGRSRQGRLGKTASNGPKLVPVTIEELRNRDVAPEDVAELPPRKRRRNKVPHVPGVSFYRTSSKRVLVAGEEVSDSDEDVDNTWLVRSQRNDLRRLGKDAIELEFNELLNGHIDDEQPDSDALIRDALVRFARNHAQQLNRPIWRDLFREKLERFASLRIITQAHLDYCVAVVLAAEEPTGSLEPELQLQIGAANGHSSRERVQALLQARCTDTQLSKDREDAAQITSLGVSRPKNDGGTRSGSTPDSPNVPSRVLHPPTLTPNSKFRARWKEGKMLPDTSCEPLKAKENPAVPFGKRMIICRRASKPKTKSQEPREHRFAVGELLKDELQRISLSPDEAEPRDLEFIKLKRVMDHEFGFIRDSDNIVHVTSISAAPVIDEKDFHAVLDAAKNGPSYEDIVFELQETSYYHDLMQSFQRNNDTSASEDVDSVLSVRNPNPINRLKPSGKGKVSNTAATRNICVCGSHADGQRGTIGCSNVYCERVSFHMACVKLSKRSVDWKCNDCRL